MKPTLKKTAQVLGAKLPKWGSISTVIDGCRVIAFTGASWCRRAVTHVSVYPSRSHNPSNMDVIATARMLAAKLMMPVQCEAIGTMIDVAPDGRLNLNPRRFIKRPLHKIP